jgi:hypothetical protein
MVAPSASVMVLCLLPRTEAAIGFDGVVAAFASRGGLCVEVTMRRRGTWGFLPEGNQMTEDASWSRKVEGLGLAGNQKPTLEQSELNDATGPSRELQLPKSTPATEITNNKNGR